ncbi:hypothetical protein AAG906_013133 [Vitis piasezkii]
MACRCCLECLLKILNFLLTLVGLAMVGYGICLFVEYKKSSSETLTISLVKGDSDVIQLGRPVMMAVTLSRSILDNLPKAWFICCFIAVGVILFVISCFGCVGAVTRNNCYLSCYAVLVILLILIELGCAAFIFFDKSWEDDIPNDKTRDFDMIYDFLKRTGKLSSLLFVLTLEVRAANKPDDYDSDDKFIAQRQSVRQPLINRPPVAATGVHVAGAIDQRPSRNDAWSTRIREVVYGALFSPNSKHRDLLQKLNTIRL